jgi:hypothetical protein
VIATTIAPKQITAAMAVHRFFPGETCVGLAIAGGVEPFSSAAAAVGPTNSTGAMEAVPSTRDCFDISGVLSRVPETLAQLGDSRVEAVIEIDERVVGPEGGAEIIAAYDFAGLFQQKLQNPEWLFLHPQQHPAFAAVLPGRDQLRTCRSELRAPSDCSEPLTEQFTTAAALLTDPDRQMTECSKSLQKKNFVGDAAVR